MLWPAFDDMKHNTSFTIAYLSDYSTWVGLGESHGFPLNGTIYDSHPNLTGLKCDFYFAKWQLNYSYANNVQNVTQVAHKTARLGAAN